MTDQRTHASVTDTPCSCGYLQRVADDPSLPIEFDPLVGEYQFKFGEPPATLVIYHCPFCGGAAPKSKRDLLFAVIPPDEEQRLADLLAPVATLRAALKRLGKPERDDPAGTRTQTSEDGDRPPTRKRHRTLVYEQLSSVADVWITESPDGRAHWQLIGKYVGPR